MITRRIFTFPIATLYTEADLILTTAESAEEKPLIDARSLTTQSQGMSVIWDTPRSIFSKRHRSRCGDGGIGP